MWAPSGLGYRPLDNTNGSVKLWGIPLEEAARRSDPDWLVPGPIRFVVDYLLSQDQCTVVFLIDSHLQDLKEEGIFRVPGSVSRVEEIKAIFQSGMFLFTP